MNRQEFFRKSLLTGLGLMIGQKYLKAGKPTESRKVNLLNTNVAGFQYYDGYDVIGKLEIDQQLTLLREPANKFDKNAVAVKYEKAKLGYIPQIDNLVIANMLDQGVEIRARIMDIDPDNHPYWALEIEVYYETK